MKMPVSLARQENFAYNQAAAFMAMQQLQDCVWLNEWSFVHVGGI